jgi:type IV fimbrial biogenesis protein FimT
MKKTHKICPKRQRQRQRQRGVTIVELAVTLTIAAILASLAAPSMQDFIRNGRLTSTSNDLLRAFQVARTEAIKRQQNVVVCATSNPSSTSATCNASTFRSGWIVFQDANNNQDHDSTEAIFMNHEAPDSTLTINGNNLAGYNGSGGPGFIAATASITVCDSRGVTAIGTNSTARALILEMTGRVHVAKSQAEVITAVSCP